MDEPFPNLGPLSDDELKGRINKLIAEEQQIEWPPPDWPPELGPGPSSV
jgi:hypothetical protein